MPKSNSYLYGSEAVLTPIPTHIITERISLLKQHLKSLLDVHYTKRDSMRINHVIKAIDFWENINNYDELEYSR